MWCGWIICRSWWWFSFFPFLWRGYVTSIPWAKWINIALVVIPNFEVDEFLLYIPCRITKAMISFRISFIPSERTMLFVLNNFFISFHFSSPTTRSPFRGDFKNCIYVDWASFPGQPHVRSVEVHRRAWPSQNIDSRPKEHALQLLAVCVRQMTMKQFEKRERYFRRSSANWDFLILIFHVKLHSEFFQAGTREEEYEKTDREEKRKLNTVCSGLWAG